MAILQSEQSEQAVSDSIPDPTVEFNSEKYQAMIADSLLSKGNNKRLKKAIKKAQNGEDVAIAYIGGSITQGTGAKPININCYAYKSFLLFKEMFAQSDRNKFTFLKAGVGGTTSELGLIRFERDVLRDCSVEPDIFIVEFAVNDGTDETKGACFESLCLKILSLKKKPAVVLLFSVFSDGWNLQDRLSVIGKRYGLPMVSIKDAVIKQFDISNKKEIIVTKRQFFSDVHHPSNIGHAVMADCLGYLFSEINKAHEDTDDIKTDISPVFGNDFIHMRLLDRKDNINMAEIDTGSFDAIDTNLQIAELDLDINGTPQFPNNWMHKPGSGNKSFRISINSSGLCLIFKDSGSSKFGKADIYVDGMYSMTVDPRKNNWTHCNTVILYNESESRKHIVEIKMAAEDEDKFFTILGFGFIQ